jgi:hypothetical protein
MRHLLAIFTSVAILVALAVPVGAQPCQQSESGLYCTQGTPEGAAPYWADLCVSKWLWSGQYQGWWAYDYNPAYYECNPRGAWIWYGNP